jgi:hypothetical protein
MVKITEVPDEGKRECDHDYQESGQISHSTVYSEESKWSVTPKRYEGNTRDKYVRPGLIVSEGENGDHTREQPENPYWFSHVPKTASSQKPAIKPKKVWDPVSFHRLLYETVQIWVMCIGLEMNVSGSSENLVGNLIEVNASEVKAIQKKGDTPSS